MMRTLHAALVAAAVLSACSTASPLVPAPLAERPAVRAAVNPPVEQSVAFDLGKVVAGGGFYQKLPATKNGSTAILSVNFVAYKGAVLTARYGPAAPAGVPAVPGSKKVLVWLTMTVDRTVTTLGNWNVVLHDGSCAPGTHGGYYPAVHQTWSTSSQYACKDFVVLPQWTRLKPGIKYVAAMYAQS